MSSIVEQVSSLAKDVGLADNQVPGFQRLFQRYLDTKADKIDWGKIQLPRDEDIVPYDTLTEDAPREILDQLVVLKLNGGLGTSMGCSGPKSAIEVRSGSTFLDLIVQQIESLNAKHNVNVPLVLMNSFNTDTDTEEIIAKYKERVTILTFNQSRYPRLRKDNQHPAATADSNPKDAWYPPGHGDCYQALKNSGVLDKLLADGKKYLFFSNADNLGATVDLRILNYFAKSGSEFFMELTNKTRADVKGGTVIRYEDKLKLLEVAQVPPEHIAEFKTITKFKVFNTNNLWVTLDAVKANADTLAMEVIENPKKMGDLDVIQLETAAGAAIQFFKGAKGINVPRTRFLPVKTTSDLFIVQSDIYNVVDGCMRMSADRIFPELPVVRLGADLKKVDGYQKLIPSIPSLVALDHLTIAGPVSIGKDVTLKGTVIIVSGGEPITIAEGRTLENVVIANNTVEYPYA